MSVECNIKMTPIQMSVFNDDFLFAELALMSMN